MRRSSMSQRGRMLIVGDQPAIDHLARQLAPDASRVGNLFEAIGEVTLAPVNEPIRTILISSDVVQRASAGAVDALRRVEPFARLVLLAHSDVSTELLQHARRHFDITTSLPVDAATLSDLLSDGITLQTRERNQSPDIQDAAPSDAAGSSMNQPLVHAQATATAPQSTASETAATETTGDAGGRRTERPALEMVPIQVEPPPIEILEQLIAPHLPKAERERRSDDDLGDTDLVEAMLRDPAGIIETALSLMRAQSGWDDLELVPTDQPETAAARAPVSQNGSDFGFLETTATDVKALEPWAAWLARWLTLDRAFRNYRAMAYQDDLTGAWNRRFFDAYLASAIKRAARLRRPVTVLVFDIDNFKLFNDQFGHEAGDTILRETVRLLQSEIRTTDRVCRIGGDEFAVIFTDIEGPRAVGSIPLESIEQIARRFQDQVCRMRFPKLGLEAPGTLSISGGLAAYPWDGSTPVELLRHADQLALESKRRGKNVITFGPGAKENCV